MDINPQHSLIYEFTGSRNLNTSPLDVTGLDGDKWDYMVEATFAGSTIDNIVLMNFNNDSSTSYRQYYMSGLISSATASTNEGVTAMRLTRQGNSTGNSTVSRYLISGDSSGERYVDAVGSETNTSSTTSVRKYSYYWKNTVDSISSIQITGASTDVDITIRIYQVPKQANLANYDLVEVVTRTSDATPIDITGLDGDSEGEYLAEIDFDVNESFNMRLNGDTGSNYTTQTLRNNAGTIQAVNGTSTTFTVSNKCFIKINAESGRKRLVEVSYGIPVAPQQNERATWWSNTADNLTEINILSFVAQTGTVKLYRRKSNRTIDPVPMMTVVEHDIAGVDFSAGITITGIEGDRINGAIKVEFVGTATSFGNEMAIIYNNDSVVSNYYRQYFYGTGSSVSAGGFNQLFRQNIKNDTSKTESWHYVKSGQNRPILAKQIFTDNIYEEAFWWNNNADELTSMKIYASNTNAITGKIRISVPVNTRQATNSFSVTVN